MVAMVAVAMVAMHMVAMVAMVAIRRIIGRKGQAKIYKVLEGTMFHMLLQV